MQYGLESENYCEGGTISDWKFDMMAFKLFSQYWNNRQEVANKAIAMFSSITKAGEKKNAKVVLNDKLDVEIQKMRNKMVNIANMFAEELIDRETYIVMKQDCQYKIDEIQQRIIENQKENENALHDSETTETDQIKKVLDGLKRMVNFVGERVPDEIIDECVNKIVMVDKTHFKWYMRNFSSDDKNSIYSILGKYCTEKELEKPMASFTIGFEEAKEYHAKNCYGVKTHPESWQDLNVDIYY